MYSNLDIPFGLIPNFIGELDQRITPSSAITVYNPLSDVITKITTIVVANTGSSPAWFSLWVDQTGVLKTNAKILFHEVKVDKNSSRVIQLEEFYLDGKAGGISAQAQNATDITMTINGIEYHNFN